MLALCKKRRGRRRNSATLKLLPTAKRLFPRKDRGRRAREDCGGTGVSEDRAALREASTCSPQGPCQKKDEAHTVYTYIYVSSQEGLRRPQPLAGDEPPKGKASPVERPTPGDRHFAVNMVATYLSLARSRRRPLAFRRTRDE
eukprot:scaffold1596_cov302-Pinguiococcus_pyrenoidosus.AAC.10